MKNIFAPEITQAFITRINALTPDTNALWGKMKVAQMLAHCNVTYEMVYDNKLPKPGAFKTYFLKLLVKNSVVSEKPYPKNSPTAPQFKVLSDKDFSLEKDRLIAYLNKTQALGETHFEGKASHSFGPLTTREWNNMFYKHLDHHLNQFGV